MTVPRQYGSAEPPPRPAWVPSPRYRRLRAVILTGWWLLVTAAVYRVAELLWLANL